MVRAPPAVHVGKVEPDGMHAHERVSRKQLRVGDFAVDQDFRPAESAERERTHQSAPCSLANHLRNGGIMNS